MRRKFRGRRKLKISKIVKFLVIIFIFFFLYKLFNVKISFNLDDNFIKYILNENNYADSFNFYKKIIDNSAHDVINMPSKLLVTNYYHDKQIENNEDVLRVDNSFKPLVYLYNSHQSEAYSMDYMEDYNINPNVLMASYMISEQLSKMGIDTVVEDADISKYLQDNNMKYYQSYEASRHFLLNAMEKYDSIILYIDVHRDAIAHELSTVNIDGLDYAKVMFVVGLEHENYLNNLDNANHLNEMIKDKYPSLTRGVLKKEGKGVNGIYNQDLADDIMLIEIGGNYNNINEVSNTVSLIGPIIGEYVNEKR